MKIAFFSDCYLDLTGGIVSSINAQKTALEQNGHTVYIFTTGYPRSVKQLQELARQNIFQVPSCKLFFRKLTPVSRRPRIIEKWLLKTHPEIKDFDIFYIHYEAGCSIAGLRLGRKLQIPTVQVMHGREDTGEAGVILFGFRTIVATALNWFHSWCIPHPIRISRDDFLADTIAKAKMWTLMINHANFADYVITPSAHFRDKLLHYGVNKEISVLPNGFPDRLFPDNPTVKSVSPGETLRMIWHSRLSGEKRIMPFLEALSKIQGKYYLDIYGDGRDYLRAKAFAKTHRLKVKFHGNTKFIKVQKAILNAHLDILVSYHGETFGNTLIEAEAHGTPVFICDPDMQEIVPRGSYILSKSESPTDMAAALNHLLSHPEQIHKMSSVMLKHRSEVLISKRIKKLEKIFQNLIA